MTIRQGKILIVDDNEDILFTLKMLLRPRVENITTCSDPKEINRLVSRNQYDVILLDMNFTTDAVSGKEGFYWLERILEIAPDTVVILITAYSDTTIFCRSNGLVRSIESYRKVTGIPIPVLEIISVNYFLNDICLLFKNLEDKIKIIPTTAHLQVIADKGLIEQVLWMQPAIAQGHGSSYLPASTKRAKLLSVQVTTEQAYRLKSRNVSLSYSSRPNLPVPVSD